MRRNRGTLGENGGTKLLLQGHDKRHMLCTHATKYTYCLATHGRAGQLSRHTLQLCLDVDS